MTYRAILIDPEAHSITELQSDLGLPTIRQLVDAERLDHFRLAQFEGNGFDFGWVNDAGLSDGKPVHAFLLSISKDPIAGRCLVVGVDHYGETCDARVPVEFLRSEVSWLGLILPEVHWDHTEQGSRAIVIYSRVKSGGS